MHDGQMDKEPDIWVRSEPWNTASPAFRREVAAMLCRIWPDCGDGGDTHDFEFQAQSFYCRINEALAGYAAVLKKDIVHHGCSFRIAGLSCVAVVPEFRRMGAGRKLVSAAGRWLAGQPDVDLGIFTCRPELAPFYNRADGWEAAPDVVLVGNSEPGALSSSALNVTVLMRLFSAKAWAHEAQLRHGTVNLDFPSGRVL